ncbi:MAG: HAMP domain-containing sensor histidine kinase [Vicinamibacterales bacterium]
MRLARRDWRPPPLLLAIAASIAAAALVLYLQQRAMSALASQNQVIVRQLAEQAATDIAVEIRRTIEGPIFDTLAAVNHPELGAGRLDLVAQHFARGLEAYPHVDRFFAWTRTPGRGGHDDVLFYGRSGVFARDAALEASVRNLARRHTDSQQIYIAADVEGDESHQVFLRLFWTDARRVDFFAVLGFVVDRETMGKRLFTGHRGRAVDDVLLRRGGQVPLQLRIADENGELVHGAPSPSAAAVRLPFPLLFYPAETIRTRLAAGVSPRLWTIEVAATPLATAADATGQRYWPTALSLFLMVTALGLTVQAHRRSAELARMQTEFVAHVSHQLKTPLSLLSTATETLQMDRIRSPEKLAEYLDTIRAEAARLSALVQRILEFSRVQERRRYEFERVDLVALVRETVDAFAHGLNQPHRFEVVASAPSAFVNADPAALEQVIANLLDNAAKYSSRDQMVTVTVRSDRQAAVVEVTDRGVGIAPADQARIFDRFYRVPGASTRQGFGLGLSIVRELVHGQGGRVDVSSARGAGSTFRVTLPGVAGPAAPDTSRIRQTEAVT